MIESLACCVTSIPRPSSVCGGSRCPQCHIPFQPTPISIPEFQNLMYLRGTNALATRIYLDWIIDTPYSANACWGFDASVGMTVFDITKLHGWKPGDPGSVLEVDFYYSNFLLGLSDSTLTQKFKQYLKTIFEQSCIESKVITAAIIRLPNAVNWYFHGFYSYMPKTRSTSLLNVYFAGDIALEPDKPHVALGRDIVSAVQKLLGNGAQPPSLVDFMW